MTTLAQFPIYFAIGGYILYEFVDVIKEQGTMNMFHIFLIICLVIESIFILMMVVDLILIQTKTIMKIDEILEDEEYLRRPDDEGIFKKIEKFLIFSLDRKNYHNNLNSNDEASESTQRRSTSISFK